MNGGKRTFAAQCLNGSNARLSSKIHSVEKALFLRVNWKRTWVRTEKILNHIFARTHFRSAIWISPSCSAEGD